MNSHFTAPQRERMCATLTNEILTVMFLVVAGFGEARTNGYGIWASYTSRICRMFVPLIMYNVSVYVSHIATLGWLLMDSMDRYQKVPDKIPSAIPTNLPIIHILHHPPIPPSNLDLKMLS